MHTMCHMIYLGFFYLVSTTSFITPIIFLSYKILTKPLKTKIAPNNQVYCFFYSNFWQKFWQQKIII